MECGNHLKIARTRDMNLVKYLGAHPDIYPHIIDDECPKNPAEWQPIDGDSRFYLIPWLDYQPIGAIIYFAENYVLFDVHIFIWPQYQNRYTVEASKLANQWMFEKTSCQCVMAFAPANKPHIKRLLKRCDFKEIGLLEKSLRQNGKLIDQFIFALGKSDYGRRQ